MKVVIFILALVVGAGSLMMVKQFKPDRPPVTPVLVANIGMPIDDVKRRSTIELGTGVSHESGYTSFIEEQKEFDWEVGGTGLRFRGCKYFWMDTGKANDPRLAYLWVTTAQKKLTYEELTREMLSIQARILADGWKPIIYNNGRAADEALRQKLAVAPVLDSLGKYQGVVTYFLKDDVVLTFLGLQLNSFQTDSDPFGQANFYHRVELKPRAEFEREWGKSIVTQ